MILINIPFFLPGFEVHEVRETEEWIEIAATSIQSTAKCPDCQNKSTRVHSYYPRSPTDLPVSDHRVRLLLTVKRFRCQNAYCTRSTFVEDLPNLIAKSARRTKRLDTALEAIAFALGGRAGSRLTSKLQMAASGDTLLRLIRNSPINDQEKPEVIGVDDWAKCRGRVYGTILVDLERRRAIDLLPDRTAETLAKWLSAHPSVKIVARDRSSEYARGISIGAPQAFQVADRWHLLVNARQALERLIDRLRPEFNMLVTPSAQATPVQRLRHRSRETELGTLEREQRRKSLHAKIHQMHQDGYAIRGIARLLSKSPMTIYKYLSMPEFPQNVARKKGSSILDPYREYLSQRWTAGMRNASQLWREIQEMGYPGTPRQVLQWAYERREHPALNTPRKYLEEPCREHPVLGSIKVPPKRLPLPVARRLVWLFLLPDHKLETEDLNLRDQLLKQPVLAQACILAQAFQHLVRKGQPQEFEGWLQRCEASGITEFNNLAKGMRKDYAAVKAAMTSSWSNGQTEGQVNRLKLLKRQMYGRAKLDLLSLRFLHPP
jgi:transposase